MPTVCCVRRRSGEEAARDHARDRHEHRGVSRSRLTRNAAQAGAAFGFQLIWAIVLGTICLIFLVEMSGRLAAVSKQPLAGAMRDRFGYPFFLVPLVTMSRSRRARARVRARRTLARDATRHRNLIPVVGPPRRVRRMAAALERHIQRDRKRCVAVRADYARVCVRDVQAPSRLDARCRGIASVHAPARAHALLVHCREHHGCVDRAVSARTSTRRVRSRTNGTRRTCRSIASPQRSACPLADSSRSRC